MGHDAPRYHCQQVSLHGILGHMNLLLIPALATVLALVALVVAIGVGSLLAAEPGSAASGRALRRRGTSAALAALVFAWAGLVLAGLVTYLAGDRAGVMALWASGPLGFVVGLVWPPREQSAGAPPADR